MAPLPSTMKVVQISQTGGIDALEYTDVPVPSPSPNTVLVRNRFSGINYIDTYMRSGLYPVPKFPHILGREAAGDVVTAHPSVADRFPAGARVVYMTGGNAGSGAYAQYSLVSADSLIPIPTEISYEAAAAIFLQGLTAWTFIREAANVQPEQWTLVHAAAGGVGLLLCQMLRAVGAKIIGTASTPEKCQLARQNGAGWTLDSRKDDVVARVKEITEGHGIDVIFDGVGKDTFEADLEMIALKGHLISFGNASGPVPPVNILRLGAKNVKLMRPVLFGYVSTRKELEKYASELFDLLAAGKVTVAIHETYPLKDAARAQKDIESRKTTGKLLLNCD
ncbi:hypothetical protein CDD81_7195 [Ophiocordyceps australis]|uniref:Probable quinone oxidoreductase n=1 Tax=Ophiocordyceps australis TaxID=1399860 RepID=A0A2C5X949_9HYPO|nr:hypothetical protein CDD81_7195 [Ophiocordyceps australis]